KRSTWRWAVRAASPAALLVVREGLTAGRPAAPAPSGPSPGAAAAAGGPPMSAPPPTPTLRPRWPRGCSSLAAAAGPEAGAWGPRLVRVSLAWPAAARAAAGLGAIAPHPLLGGRGGPRTVATRRIARSRPRATAAAAA